MPTVFSIEGNIGAGKTTFLKRLREMFATDPRVVFVEEPTAEWDTLRDEQGAGMLECYYRDQNRYAFPFQMLAYISRLTALRRALLRGPAVVVTERSLETDRRVFAQMLHDHGHIGRLEMSIYQKWFDEFLTDLPPVKHLYLRCDPRTAAERVVLRARAGEKLDLDYLQTCHDYHESWLLGGSSRCVVCIPAEADTRVVPDALDHQLANARKMICDAYRKRVDEKNKTV